MSANPRNFASKLMHGATPCKWKPGCSRRDVETVLATYGYSLVERRIKGVGKRFDAVKYEEQPAGRLPITYVQGRAMLKALLEGGVKTLTPRQQHSWAWMLSRDPRFDFQLSDAGHVVAGLLRELDRKERDLAAAQFNLHNATRR